VLLVVIFLVILAVRSLFSNKPEVTEVDPTPTIVLPTVSENIKVDLTPLSGNKAVKLNIKGLTPEMESVEYELTYVTGNGLPRGVLGKINLKGEKEITRSDIVLGTCSSGKCAYDSGVTSVNLSLKFNSAAKASVFQKTYSL
ncbi:hypothetical protein HY945_05075, partial [Candidatus Gottesmanbacteria bacterium]|nr:hypothetical protein [Candidatus Gottesmanbacteria bacterium]